MQHLIWPSGRGDGRGVNTLVRPDGACAGAAFVGLISTGSLGRSAKAAEVIQLLCTSWGQTLLLFGQGVVGSFERKIFFIGDCKMGPLAFGCSAGICVRRRQCMRIG